MAKKERRWLTQRVLTEEGTGVQIPVQIGRPERDPQSSRGYHRCAYRIGRANPVQYASGVDPMASLINALGMIRHALDESQRSLSWKFGEPGEHGFPRHVSSVFGLAFSRPMEQLLDAELERFGNEIRTGIRPPVLRPKKKPFGDFNP